VGRDPLLRHQFPFGRELINRRTAGGGGGRGWLMNGLVTRLTLSSLDHHAAEKLISFLGGEMATNFQSSRCGEEGERVNGEIDGPIRSKHRSNHRIERGLAKHAGCGPYLISGNNRIYFLSFRFTPIDEWRPVNGGRPLIFFHFRVYRETRSRWPSV
jgi:hypothetical protein